MRNRHKFKIESANGKATGQRQHLDRDLVQKTRFAKLEAQDLGCEGRAINRLAQARPEPWQRAQMILMGVSQNDAGKSGAIGFKERQIGQDDVDSGLGLLAELHAQVDENPLPIVGWAQTIGIAVHADLAHAAQRNEHEFAARWKGVFRSHAFPSARSDKLTSPA